MSDGNDELSSTLLSDSLMRFTFLGPLPLKPIPDFGWTNPRPSAIHFIMDKEKNIESSLITSLSQPMTLFI
jgi:hypothetical protein